jgi:hypothetical protein
MTNTAEGSSAYTATQQQIDIINNVADALLTVENEKAKARDSIEAGDKGQLAMLIEGLAAYPGVVTEVVWDNTFKASVAERLEGPSKHTLLNRMKRAVMGLTLAKKDASFAPKEEHTNLRKYADWVGKELQKEDPATGKPRLKSPAKPTEPKPPKLRDGQTYWLLGAAREDQPYQWVIAEGTDLTRLRAMAMVHADKFNRFGFIIAAPPKALDISKDDLREFRVNVAPLTETGPSHPA